MSAQTAPLLGGDRAVHRDVERLRVVYIAGCGRSGSTFLDVLLGNHADVVSAGELAKHIANDWSAGRLCSCGRPCEACDYWTAVRRLWTARIGTSAASRYARLERRFTRMRSWPALLRSQAWPTRAFRGYAEATLALYESVARVSGCATLIDSSKLPIRGYALSLMGGLDLRVIHLVRDPRGVAWSHIRRARERAGGGEAATGRGTTGRVIAEWLSRNVQASTLRRRLTADRALLLRYEDLVREPAGALDRIGALIGCDLSEVSARLADDGVIRIGHVAAGNRLRLEPVLKLRPDVDWMAKLPGRDERMIRTLCGVALRRYQYPA